MGSSKNSLSRNEKFSKEIEAAWYVLKEFINPLDCSEKFINRVIPLNYNLILASILSGNSTFKACYFSKIKLKAHMIRSMTYYYRSSYKAVHTEGYGAHDIQAQRLSFAEELNITHKVKKYEGAHVILVGIDIDAHNNEQDVMKVENWLKTDIFKESYWEPSSNLKGRP